MVAGEVGCRAFVESDSTRLRQDYIALAEAMAGGSKRRRAPDTVSTGHVMLKYARRVEPGDTDLRAEIKEGHYLVFGVRALWSALRRVHPTSRDLPGCSPWTDPQLRLQGRTPSTWRPCSCWSACPR